MKEYILSTANTKNDLLQIQALQYQNLERSISSGEISSQGFVTCQHSMELLMSMNSPHQHIVVKYDHQIVGYALVMLTHFSDELEVLKPMFEELKNCSIGGIPLKEEDYFIMGQVCIAKAHRGKGVFGMLYSGMRTQMKAHFQYCITEIAIRNTRSIRAHEKIGFREFHRYTTEEEEWVLVAWDWT